MVNNPTVDTLLKYAYEKKGAIADISEPNTFLVETKLDSEGLLESILKGEYKLVFLLGTPGCGKSEFLHALKRSLSSEASDLEIIIKHDATHVKGIKGSSVEELKELLSDFKDSRLDEMLGVPRKKAVSHSLKDLAVRVATVENKNSSYVVGINRGILNRLLVDKSFKKLDSICHEDDVNSRIIIIDLTKRDYVSDPEGSDGLYARLIRIITSPSKWEEGPCVQCDVRNYCPMLFNAKYLYENIENNPVKFNLKLLQLKKQCVLTFRDILAVLSHAIAGHRKYYAKNRPICDSVKKMISENRWQRLANLYIWNSANTDEDLFKRLGKSLQAKNYKSLSTSGRAPERFFKKNGLISQFDPIRNYSGKFDAYAQKVFTDPEFEYRRINDDGQLTDLEKNLFKELFDNLKKSLNSKELTNRDKTSLNKNVSIVVTHYLKRRKYFLEFNQLSALEKSEYCSLDTFEKYILNETATSEDIKNIVKKGLIMSGRIPYKSELPQFILSEGLRYSDVVLQLHYDTFDVEIEKVKLSTFTKRYVEVGLSAPVLIKVMVKGESVASLELTLDRLEVLKRISEGFDPEYVGRFGTDFIGKIKDAVLLNIEFYQGMKVILKKVDSEEEIEMEFSQSDNKFLLR